MNIKILLFILFFISKTNYSFAPFVYPRQYGAEARFKSFTYNEEAIYRFEGFFDQATLIELDEKETVRTMYPNHRCWQITPQQNKLFLRPIQFDTNKKICTEEDSKFTLTIMTEERKYFLAVSASKGKDPFDGNFVVQFRYPKKAKDSKGKASGSSGNIIQYAVQNMPDIKNPKNNLNYTASGDKSIIPSLIFDDGRFIYMKFDGIVPGVFSVDKDGYEGIVNFRMIGPYLAVEGIYKIFTLRYGATTACIFNENIIKLETIN